MLLGLQEIAGAMADPFGSDDTDFDTYKICKDAYDNSWLTGDEIIELITADNPDSLGVRPTWLSGPGPLNYFYTFFAQTLASSAHHGRVHIMVVNTAKDTGVAPPTMGGVHWFVVAWYIEPQQ